MIVCLPVEGFLEENCYVWVDEKTGHGFLIDPGAQGGEIWDQCTERGWIIERILLTHGHFDHIGGIDAIRARQEIPVWIHENGIDYLRNPRLNLSAYFGKEITVDRVRTFRDGDLFRLQADPSRFLRVIHTPGHTPDSVLFYDEAEGTAFTGDTIFQGNRGNDTFPGGDGKLLLKSIRERVLTLPGETRLYSGHSGPTTVAAERPLYLS